MLEPTDEDIYDALQRIMELMPLSLHDLDDMYCYHAAICRAIEELEWTQRGEA